MSVCPLTPSSARCQLPSSHQTVLALASPQLLEPPPRAAWPEGTVCTFSSCCRVRGPQTPDDCPTSGPDSLGDSAAPFPVPSLASAGSGVSGGQAEQGTLLT